MDERRLAAEGICLALAEAGHRALLAGGCVRDMLLGVELILPWLTGLFQ